MPETSALTTAGIWAAALGFLGLIVRSVGPWRKQITETEERLRKELSELLVVERAEHAAERDSLTKRVEKLEKVLKSERASRDAERALDRHRLNNITQCFDALLLLIKANPDKADDVVKMIEEMRAKQLVAEAEEKAIIRAANIIHDEEGRHDDA